MRARCENFLPIFIVVLVFLTQGCALNERVSYTDSEGQIPQDVLQRIKDNQTTKAWVLSHLGDPFAVDRVEYASKSFASEQGARGKNHSNIHEVYTWRLVRSKFRSAHALYVFRSGSRQDDIEYFHVLFNDGVVKKSWMDQYAGVQMGVRESKKLVLTLPEGKPEKTNEAAQDEEGFDWKLPVLKKWFGVAEKKQPEQQYSNEPPETVEDARAQEQAQEQVLEETIDEAPVEELDEEIEQENKQEPEPAAQKMEAPVVEVWPAESQVETVTTESEQTEEEATEEEADSADPFKEVNAKPLPNEIN